MILTTKVNMTSLIVIWLFLGRFRIFENRPLDPVLSLRVISEKKANM